MEPVGSVKGGGVLLQVLVCVYGKEGMERFAATNPPGDAVVEYIVSWQLPRSDMDAAIPKELAARDDISIYKSGTRGLCRNRNLAMELATAPYCLISDDDVVYCAPCVFRRVIDAFSSGDVDVACFKSTCLGKELKPYPTAAVPVAKAPKGWYATSFEIAYRRGSVAGRTRFNENFGIGSDTCFQAGEEDIWLYDARKAGAREWIFPHALCAHDHPTTTERHGLDDWFIMTGGAVYSHLHPLTWRLRKVVHAFRQKQKSWREYLSLSIKGAKIARKKGYFKGPSGSRAE